MAFRAHPVHVCLEELALDEETTSAGNLGVIVYTRIFGYHVVARLLRQLMARKSAS